MGQKKVAIFASYLDNIGGSELLTLILARELNATIYTTNFDKGKIRKMGFKNIKIKSIGKVPKNAPFRQQLVFWKFRKMNLKNKYDFYIVSGDWAMPALVNNKPNLWYIHSPINEVFAFRDYVRTFLPFYKKPIYDLWSIYIRNRCIKYQKSSQKLVCNSKNTHKRIKKYFKRNATIIYPPTETGNYKNLKSKGYWLSVNRLALHKRVDIQMKAFNKLPNENLLIIGSYEKGAKQFEDNIKFLKKCQSNNIKIKSWVSYEELLKHYSECKGFITTAQDEDFGMTPVEAMAAGKPVIAANEGGYKETVVDGETGFLIDNINADQLSEKITIVSDELEKNPDLYRDACQKRAKQFDVQEFIRKIKNEIEK